jgi:hypothetical protein
LFHGTPVLRKDKPRWVISNLADTKSDAYDTVVAQLGEMFRHLGERLFMSCDEEAWWRGWDITQRHAGLGRSYRDPRFDARRPVHRQLDPLGEGSLCPPGDPSGQTTRA